MADLFDEDDLLPISALQHLIFCERQCTLIHLDGVWLDNALTVEGTHLHRRADSGVAESRKDVVAVRAVPIRSLRLGLTGRADVIEFVRTESGTALPRRTGHWSPRPVEYKRGRPKAHRADEVQLCAQALCMEEMFEVAVPYGDLYYGARRRRSEVPFDGKLRQLTESAATRLRALLRGDRSPPARYEPKCDSCSLLPACMPTVVASARAFVALEVRSGDNP